MSVYSTAFRLLVVGGAEFDDNARVFAALDAADARRRIGYVLHTDARGAAALAGAWARDRKRPHEILRVATGPERGRQILDCAQADAVILFPGGRALDEMLQLAKAAGLPVWRPFAHQGLAASGVPFRGALLR